MCIPPPQADEALQHEPFRRLREVLLDLNRGGHSLDTLSMGMSADLEAAIAEGATIVRVGTAIFGPRTEYGERTMAHCLHRRRQHDDEPRGRLVRAALRPGP